MLTSTLHASVLFSAFGAGVIKTLATVALCDRCSLMSLLASENLEAQLYAMGDYLFYEIATFGKNPNQSCRFGVSAFDNSHCACDAQVETSCSI